MSSNRFVFITACLGMLLFGISLTTLGSMAPVLQAKFSLDPVSAGALFSILPFGIVAGSLVFGPIVDKYGYKIILVASSLLMLAGFEGIAYSNSPLLLKTCVLLFGLGGGAINGATNAVVSDISNEGKGANLSLLGVFFAVGALGMPFLLGMLEKVFSAGDIVSSVGYLALLAAVLFALTPFPTPKQSEGVSGSTVLGLVKDNFLLLIGLFLLFQSGFEGVINNWTTTYLMNRSIQSSDALFALSSYVAGMAVTRVLLGSVLRNTPPRIILLSALGLLFVGCLSLHFASSYTGSIASLIVIGVGLAPGFPVMLGFTGERYAAVSGTAFSIVISIALCGNMIVSYVSGIYIREVGLENVMIGALAISVMMLLLTLTILKRKRTNQ